MVCSLFTRHLMLGAARSVAVRAARPATFSVGTRRALFATPHFNFPPAKTSAKATHKTAEEKAGNVPSKRGRPRKTATELHQEKPKQEKVRIPKELMPPKRAPGPYILFFSSFLNSQPQSSSLQEFRELAKRGGETWKEYSMVEKQPFYDESEARKVQAAQKRDEFFRNISLSDLKRLNSIRKAQGKTRIRSTLKSPLPITPFIIFSNEFRSSPDGQAIINETSFSEKRYTVRVVLAAADRWRSMSTEEKAPYFERYKKAKEELKAEHAES